MTRFIALFILSYPFIVAPAWSQAPLHRVSGHVTDASRLPVPAASILLERSGVEPQSAQSDWDGSFLFEFVPTGEYNLQVTLEGFEPHAVPLTVGQDVVGIEASLEIESYSDEITVEADNAGAVTIDPSDNRDGLRLDREMLDGLPMMDEDVVAAASRFLDDGALGSEGVSLIVDGMETDAIGVSSSAIEEVRINKNPYSAEYSRPGRGRIEIITKQGSQQFHGTANFVMRDYRLDARNAFADDRPEQLRRKFEGHFSGPIGSSGKNTFLLSAERDIDDQQSIIFAQTLAGTVRDTFAQPERETEFSARFNRYAGDKHMWSARYSLDREREAGSGVGGFDLPETGYTERESSDRIGFDYKWFASPEWLADFSVRLERESDRSQSDNPGQPRIEVLDAFTGGGAQRHEVSSETELEISLVASWSGGNHFIRTGFLVPDLAWYTIDDRDNFGGTYTFASLADYETGNPFSFTQRQGDSRISFQSRRLAGFVQDDIRLGDSVRLGVGMRYDWQNFVGDHNNFAPRVSLAWSPGGSRKTVVRVGGGLFYDRAGSSVFRDVLRFDGLRLREILLIQPGYPHDLLLGVGDGMVAPAGGVRLAPELSSPYVTQYSAGVERELRPSLTLAVNYVGVRGSKLFRSLDRNAPFGPDLSRPDPTLAEIREIESSGTLKSHALNVDLRGRLSKRLRGAVLYTWGRAYNDTPGRDDLPPNSLDLRGQWARADFDRRHRLRLTGNLALPGSLNLGTIFMAGSGRPYDWTTGEDANRDGRAEERPAGVSRNVLERPGSHTVDVRMSRKFRLGGKGEKPPVMTVAANAFNLLNEVNYTRFVGNQNSPLFRQPTAAGSARRMQISLKVSF